VPDRTVFIVGAGFSANAGLPLQSGFTKLFLKAEGFTTGRSRYLMPLLRSFVKTDVSSYPELEDVFTMLDLSANSGHHLGVKFAPGELRKVRRMLLSRTIHMLNTAYLNGKKNDQSEREQLLDFVSKLSPKRHKFVSLNWDVVLEGCLGELQPNMPFHYSPEIKPATIDDDDNELKTCSIDKEVKSLLIAKMHGSINWLYCDCCRRAYSVPVDKVSRLGVQVLKLEEAAELYGKKAPSRLECPSCGVDLGVRLATFSYRKALRAPMFESSWLEAEKALRYADRWVFIGYSLPAADFEFKYLLKRIQLARAESPEIFVVTKTDRDKVSPTLASYTKFFGKGNFTVFRDGLTTEAIDTITRANRVKR
jgi:NAD-dependent SIR2 family protein deacetylase